MEVIFESDLQVDIPDDLTLPEYLMRKMELYGQRSALMDPDSGRSMTFQELCENIPRLGASLWHKCGVRAGTRVGLVAPNCIEYPLSYLAIMHVGAVCVPIAHLSTKYELEYLIGDSEIDTIITVPELVEKFQHVQQSLPCVLKIILIGEGYGLVSIDRLLGSNLQSSIPDLRPTINSKEDLATICYSSGTTGSPKGFMHTHFNYVANMCQVSHPELENFEAGQDVTISALPMSHMYGQLTYLTHALALGCTQVVLKRYHLEHLLSLAQEHQATILHVVPPMIVQLIKSPTTDQFDLSSVKVIETSASNLLQETATQLSNKLPQARLTQGYGMTEIMFISKERNNKRISGDVGKLYPNVLLKVIDPVTGKSLKPGEDGELCFRTPNVVKGYLEKPSLTKLLVSQDGFLRTGDIGHIDGDGNLVVVDRLKDLIKYKANQVSPAELEAVILRHPKIDDVAVVGIPDAEAGEIPKAFVVKKKDEILEEQEIINFVKTYVSPHKRLHGGVTFVDQVPKSAAGKILRRQLRNFFTSKL